MRFEEYVTDKLGDERFEELANNLGSNNMRTRILKTPQNATNDQILILAEFLGRTPWSLIEQYKLGENTLTQLELEYHHSYHHLHGD